MAKDFLEIYTRLILGGYDLSGDSRTFGSAGAMSEARDMTVWTDLVKPGLAGAYIDVGVQGYQALINDAVGRAFQRMKDTPNLQPLSLLFGSGGDPAAGDPAYILDATQMGDLANFNNGVGVLSADFMPRSGRNYPHGRVLLPSTPLTATGNGTAVVDPAASANGGHAILHILATSSGDYAFTVEHSPDGVSWATLVAFTLDGSAVGAEAVEFTGAVDAQVRLVRTRTAGTCTAVCTLARN